MSPSKVQATDYIQPLFIDAYRLEWGITEKLCTIGEYKIMACLRQAEEYTYLKEDSQSCFVSTYVKEDSQLNFAYN